MNETTTQPTTTSVATAERSVWRDLFIPISIVIAGICIGLGIYFSGGAGMGAGGPLAAAPTAPEEPADTTDQINEVTEADHIKGSLDAPIKIVEYSDFDCPFCNRFHVTMEEIAANNDDVAWVYRHFPLEQLHPQARAVAVASECVAQIGGDAAFWTFTDGYYAARAADDSTPHAELIPQLVVDSGVTQAPFEECFNSGEVNSLVQEDIDNAIATGGRGTPWSILIGPTGKTYPINGALPRAAVEQVIELALEEA